VIRADVAKKHPVGNGFAGGAGREFMSQETVQFVGYPLWIGGLILLMLLTSRAAKRSEGGLQKALRGALGLAVIIGWFVAGGVILPSAGRAMASENEATALRTLRTVHAAQQKFLEVAPGSVYGTLGQLANFMTTEGDPLGRQLADGEADGYRYRLDVVSEPEPGFTAVAEPIRPGQDGARCFMIDETGTLRFEILQRPTRDSPVLQ
jgi:hypothetical protein